MRFDDDEQFLRGIHPDWFDFDKQKILSWAFDNHPLTPERMSVNWAKLSSIDDTVKANPVWGVASITAATFYKENQDVDYTPIETNIAHCDVIGHKSLSVRRRLRNAAKLLRSPSQISFPSF